MNKVSGKTLKSWGFTPGDWFKVAIPKANELREAGKKDREIIEVLNVMGAEMLPLQPKVPDPALVPVRRPDLAVMEPPITVYGEHDEKTLGQLTRCMTIGSAVKGVLCADGHLGYGHPIGGVIAYEDHISISGVGFDIACGNMAVKLDTLYEEIAKDAGLLIRDIGEAISFGVGRKNAERVDHALFESHLWNEIIGVDGALKKKAQEQLGTVGSGNHYVDLFEGDDGHVWIGVHFGSRGLGHTITTKHLALVGAKDGMEVDPALIPITHDIGRSYINGIELGGLYAYAGREWVVEKVRSIVGGSVLDTIHNHHNFAWLEEHDGRKLWVVRKGATPAFPGQRGFVGGSMGDNAVILEGVDTQQARDSLYSTVHGAGRVMSRMDARGRTKLNPETGKRERQQGRIRHDEWQQWIRGKGVHLVGGEIDEAPQAYRRLPEVLAAQGDTINVLHTLRPFAVAMAGDNVTDPYKD